MHAATTDMVKLFKGSRDVNVALLVGGQAHHSDTVGVGTHVTTAVVYEDVNELVYREVFRAQVTNSLECIRRNGCPSYHVVSQHSDYAS